jgi:hypothetical protein
MSQQFHRMYNTLTSIFSKGISYVRSCTCGCRGGLLKICLLFHPLPQDGEIATIIRHSKTTDWCAFLLFNGRCFFNTLQLSTTYIDYLSLALTNERMFCLLLSVALHRTIRSKKAIRLVGIHVNNSWRKRRATTLLAGFFGLRVPDRLFGLSKLLFTTFWKTRINGLNSAVYRSFSISTRSS